MRLSDVEDHPIALSPDGKWVLAFGGASGDRGRLVLVPTGAGERKPVDLGPVIAQWGAFFPDSKRLIITGDEPGKEKKQSYVVPMEGGTPRFLFEGFASRVSPDGKLILAGQRGVGVVLIAEDGKATPIPEWQWPEDRDAGWSADGRTLYLSRARPCSIHRFDLITRKRELIKMLSPADPLGVSWCADARVAADGRSYAYRYTRRFSTLYLVEGLR